MHVCLQDELVKRAQEAQHLRHLQVERAQYEADLAQRRYLKVDPDNRLVATVLEAEWNRLLLRPWQSWTAFLRSIRMQRMLSG